MVQTLVGNLSSPGESFSVGQFVPKGSILKNFVAPDIWRFYFIYEYILSKIVLHYLTFLNSRSGALDAQLNCLSTFFRRWPTPFPFIFSSPTWFCQREFLMRQNVSLSEFKFSGLSLLNKHVFSSWYHLMWKSFFLCLFYDFVNWYILISFIRHYFKRLT